jgi:hypothetical protein
MQSTTAAAIDSEKNPAEESRDPEMKKRFSHAIIH